ncbi:MAG: hypothetical protein KY466_09875 [Gemmatimonadetes bacterium]|nr:hypothetical protein [Gemmatimonadota bacterium]
MAIPDLLWACPVCALDRGLRASGDATCSGCGTRFDRVHGARIRATGRGGEERVRTAAEWVDDLPDPASLIGARDPFREASVVASFVEGEQVIRFEGRYVNRIEKFGAKQRGRLALGPERLTYAPEGPGTLSWAFGDLRAVQASSRTLQIRGGAHPLVSFAFLDDSSYLWDRLLAAALATFYRRSGRGEIVELQPRIVTR